MDTNTIIEGTVKFRDGKKWKSRWCVVRKLSPVADCIHLQLYRDSKERYKHGQTKASLSLENFLGIQSGFTVDKESNTLAIICQEVIVVLAFDTREHLMQWQVKITSNLGEGDQFLVQISSAPSRAKLAAGPARLLIQEYQFCLTVGVPPRLISFWQITHLRRFGVVGGKFCFEGGSRCGRGEGLYVLVSEKPDELTRAFHLAAEGKLFTRKRPVARNMSVMEKVRKHHTLRPESQLSDVSSLNSTVMDSQQGSESNKTCGSCSQSHEDLLSWPLHFPDTISTCESHRFDLKPFWSSEVGIGRCTSCMSKLGSMSRSSTLTNTPGSCFPAWTMDRPKSCGSGKMSSSVTCSSISLSSHSSRGSSCGNDQSNRQHIPPSTDNSCACGGGRSTPQTPPTRPPKPAHLSLLRLQANPSSPSTPSSPHTCCCPHSPYGNYDVPKPLSVSRSTLKLDLKKSPVRSCSTPLSAVEFYDTPRKLKESLNWDYGNYDIPPPAQPVSPSSQNSHKSVSREPTEDMEALTKLKESLTLKLNENEEKPLFPINKVKLTGEGRMPVMSPCGKILERPEPTYEERLDSLLENDIVSLSTNTNKSNLLYANVTPIETCMNIENMQNDNTGCKMNVSSEQNYANIGIINSLENYENFECFLPEQNVTNTIIEHKTELNNKLEDEEENCSTSLVQKRIPVFCSKCAHTCTPEEMSEIHLNSDTDPCSTKQLNQNVFEGPHHCSKTEKEETECIKRKILNSKCNSTSCLQEIKGEQLNLNEKNEKNLRHYEVKTIPRLSNSVTNSPDLKRITGLSLKDNSITTRFYNLSLRKRSNSADSARLHLDDESVHDTNSTDSHEKSRVLSNLSSTDSLCAIEKIEDSEIIQKKEAYLRKEFNVCPLIISEKEDLGETEDPQQRIAARHFDTICARRSASVPNKFFSNRDSSSSNDSGVSTGSLTMKHFGPDFLEFEMPLTTSMSSKRHHIAVLNGHISNANGEIKHLVPKRSKSVDPLRDLAFTFELGDQQNGKSTSAEAEVPMFLLENKSKEYLSPQTTTTLPDSRSTSSGTSDMSDYFETLSFSSFSSLDAHDNLRNGRASIPTMKPRSGKEYQKIDRYLLEQETKE